MVQQGCPPKGSVIFTTDHPCVHMCMYASHGASSSTCAKQLLHPTSTPQPTTRRWRCQKPLSNDQQHIPEKQICCQRSTS
jgi:hypothetical protein